MIRSLRAALWCAALAAWTVGLPLLVLLLGGTDWVGHGIRLPSDPQVVMPAGDRLAAILERTGVDADVDLRILFATAIVLGFALGFVGAYVLRLAAGHAVRSGLDAVTWAVRGLVRSPAAWIVLGVSLAMPAAADLLASRAGEIVGLTLVVAVPVLAVLALPLAVCRAEVASRAVPSRWWRSPRLDRKTLLLYAALALVLLAVRFGDAAVPGDAPAAGLVYVTGALVLIVVAGLAQARLLVLGAGGSLATLLHETLRRAPLRAWIGLIVVWAWLRAWLEGVWLASWFFQSFVVPPVAAWLDGSHLLFPMPWRILLRVLRAWDTWGPLWLAIPSTALCSLSAGRLVWSVERRKAAS